MMCMVAFGGPQQLEPDEVAARDDVQFQQSLEAVLDNNESAGRVEALKHAAVQAELELWWELACDEAEHMGDDA